MDWTTPRGLLTNAASKSVHVETRSYLYHAPDIDVLPLINSIRGLDSKGLQELRCSVRKMAPLMTQYLQSIICKNFVAVLPNP